MLFRFLNDLFSRIFRGIKTYAKVWVIMGRFILKRIFVICPRQWADFKETCERLDFLMGDGSAFEEDFNPEDVEIELGRIKWYLVKHPEGGIYMD